MRWKAYSILIFFVLTVVSCFEEDQAVPPYELPENVDSLSILHSIYHYQVYFDFSSGNVVAENENTEWVLSFECGESGYHIRINSSNFWGVAHTGSSKMDSIYSVNPDLIWKQDKSDGNPDSTAIGSWVSFEDATPKYTNEVYLIGTYDGIAYNLSKKVQFISVNEEAYTFLIGDPDGSDPDTIEVVKDKRVNYIQFSMEDNSTLQLEPDKEEWDILFSQYFTILYTDDSIRAPYYVRGVLLNPNLVEAALDSTINFLDVNYSNASQNIFFSSQDYIGHDWKSVTVDEASNSAEYKVRPGYTYIVRDANNVLYKFRFKSYFNKSGIKGYPSIEFAKLNTE